jgi:regulation of enolase protein 1 (concanavalin A-like superfamily)
VDDVDNEGSGPKAIISLPNEGDVVRGTSAEYFGGSNLDGSTSQAQFFVDGVLAYTDVGPGHYHFGGSHAAWNTTTLAEGNHTLKLAIVDGSGNAGAHQIDVSVDNLPSPWNHLDLGAVGATGTARHSSGTFTLEGAGADIWGTADEFHFVRKKLSGDGEIKARVASVENTDTWAKAGVMIRETLTAGSRHAHMLISAGGASAFQRRTATGGSSASTSGSAGAAPRWVRVTRSGSTFRGFVSPDGTTWTEVGSASISMAADVFIGLAVTSHKDGTLSTAVFDHVTTVGTTSFVDPGDDVGDPDPTVSSGADSEPDGLRSGCVAAIARSTGSTTGGALAALVAAALVTARRSARRARSRSGSCRGLPRDV